MIDSFFNADYISTSSLSMNSLSSTAAIIEQNRVV